MVMHKSIKEKGNVNLHLIGDLHIGTNTFDKKSFDKAIDMMQKDKDARVIFMGDQLDLIEKDDTRRYNKFTMDKQINSAEAQYQYFLKKIKPLKKKIYGILSGNHEIVYAKNHSDQFSDKSRDHAERVCEELGVTYLNDMGVVALKVGRHQYHILVAHGCGAASTVGAQVMKLLNIASIYDLTADVIAMGHVHNLQSITNPKMDFKFNTKTKFLGLTGTYYQTYIKNNMNYASSSLYKPSSIGHLVYTMKTDGVINDNKIIFT